MTNLEKQLDECNLWLYKILNKVADMKLNLKVQETLRNELKEQQDD